MSNLQKKYAIGIVCSTLPIRAILHNREVPPLEKIIVTSSALERSYSNLIVKKPDILIQKAPSKSTLLQSFYFLIKILQIKITGRELVFFHECCMPFLDLIIFFIKPSGYYFPQVSLEGSVKIDFEKMPTSFLKKLLSYSSLNNYFNYFLAGKIGDDDSEIYYISAKGYPKSIVSHQIGYNRKKSQYTKSYSTSKKILFLVGKAKLSDRDQIKIFENIFYDLKRLNYLCFVKDHPNPNFRIDFDISGITYIDSTIPIELIEDDFRWIIGLSSTALLNFGNKAISILKVTNMSFENKEKTFNHFNKTDPENRIHFVENYEELIYLIEHSSVENANRLA